MEGGHRPGGEELRGAGQRRSCLFAFLNTVFEHNRVEMNFGALSSCQQLFARQEREKKKKKKKNTSCLSR